jgi:hypothetical protein
MREGFVFDQRIERAKHTLVFPDPVGPTIIKPWRTTVVSYNWIHLVTKPWETKTFCENMYWRWTTSRYTIDYPTHSMRLKWGEYLSFPTINVFEAHFLAGCPYGRIEFAIINWLLSKTYVQCLSVIEGLSRPKKSAREILALPHTNTPLLFIVPLERT